MSTWPQKGKHDMKVRELSEEVKEILKNAAHKMTGATRRAYLAEVTVELCDGNARQAERIFGWGRGTITKGLRERATGIRCVDAYAHRGRKKTEEKQPQLVEDLRRLVEPRSQADPKFQTPFAYTRVTAKAVREELIAHQGYTDDELPCENTIGNILNRLDYRLKRIQKTTPVKKTRKPNRSLRILTP
jgi:transposase